MITVQSKLTKCWTVELKHCTNPDDVLCKIKLRLQMIIIGHI